MSREKVMLVSDVVIDHGDEIKKLYAKGATVTRLKIKFGCSRNTMVRVLVKMGLNEGPKWLKDQELAKQK